MDEEKKEEYDSDESESSKIEFMVSLTVNVKAETILSQKSQEINQNVEEVNLDSFKLIEVLGTGAHAKVYLA